MKNQSGFSRAERVGQQIHQLVARLLLLEADDPRLKELQVTGVDVTQDLRSAKIYYVLLSGEEPDEGIKKAVEGVTGFVKSRIGTELSLRYVPDIEIRFDEAVLRGRRIDDLLSNLRDDQS